MLKKINTNAEVLNNIKYLKVKKVVIPRKNINLGKLIFKDMMMYTKIWRQIRGYSSNGQRSHSNNKGNKKNRTVYLFRIQQFYKMFGRKKRDIFPTLILAEYNNRLWYFLWTIEWWKAHIFVIILASKTRQRVKFDPHLLSKNIVTGLPKIRKKKRHNQAKKKILQIATIGVPVFFSLYLYNYKKKYRYRFVLVIPDESRRKMGKKKKKNKKK